MYERECNAKMPIVPLHFLHTDYAVNANILWGIVICGLFYIDRCQNESGMTLHRQLKDGMAGD